MLRHPSNTLALSFTHPTQAAAMTRSPGEYLWFFLTGTCQSHEGSSSIFFLLMCGICKFVSEVSSSQEHSKVSIPLRQSAGSLVRLKELAVAEGSSIAPQQWCYRERSVLLWDWIREDQQRPHPRCEGSLLGLLQQALAFWEQGQSFFITWTLPFMLFFQGQLALGIPQSSQSIQAVFQQAGIRVALIPTNRA